MRAVSLILITFALCAGAFGQNYSTVQFMAPPAMTSTVTMPDHAAPLVHRSLFERGASTFARGEVPLYEVPGLWKAPRPLGDVAREYREEHAKARKAIIVWEP
jgi:hypothetical protein